MSSLVTESLTGAVGATITSVMTSSTTGVAGMLTLECR